jgi:polyphosphate kinase
MPRNLYDRVEAMFPVKDPQIAQRICNEILASYLADTRKARVLNSDGTYSRPRAVRNGHGFSVQEHLMRVASGTIDSPRTRPLVAAQVVYTAPEVKPGPTTPPDESDTQENINAAV